MCAAQATLRREFMTASRGRLLLALRLPCVHRLGRRRYVDAVAITAVERCAVMCRGCLRERKLTPPRRHNVVGSGEFPCRARRKQGADRARVRVPMLSKTRYRTRVLSSHGARMRKVASVRRLRIGCGSGSGTDVIENNVRESREFESGRAHAQRQDLSPINASMRRAFAWEWTRE